MIIEMILVFVILTALFIGWNILTNDNSTMRFVAITPKSIKITTKCWHCKRIFKDNIEYEKLPKKVGSRCPRCNKINIITLDVLSPN